jgi:hypothetical protein
LNFNTQWPTAIFQTDFIRKNGINCPLGVSYNEDVVFQLKAAYLSQGIETVDDVQYYYCRHGGSAASKVLEAGKILSQIRAREEVIAFVNEHRASDEDYDKMFFDNIMICFRSLYKAGPDIEIAALFCSEAAIRIYAVCRRRGALDARLSSDYPALRERLAAGNISALADLLLHYKTPKQRKVADFVSGLRKKNLHDFRGTRLDCKHIVKEQIN